MMVARPMLPRQCTPTLRPRRKRSARSATTARKLFKSAGVVRSGIGYETKERPNSEATRLSSERPSELASQSSSIDTSVSTPLVLMRCNSSSSQSFPRGRSTIARRILGATSAAGIQKRSFTPAHTPTNFSTRSRTLGTPRFSAAPCSIKGISLSNSGPAWVPVSAIRTG